MTPHLDAHTSRRLRTIDAALADWRDGNEHFERTVADTVELHDYDERDVRAQLEHVARVRCSSAGMIASIEAELGEAGLPDRRPGEVLHLVASTIPGLALESVLVASVLGARSQVRPSREETVLGHFLTHAAATAPALVGMVELVQELRWATPDAAVVYGSDETVAFARERMGDRAVAAYGSREGIAVVTPAAADWAAPLAGDVLAFRQRGCMSPSHLFAVDGDAPGGLRTALSQRIGTEAAHRAARDDAALSAIATADRIEVSSARLTVHHATRESLPNDVARLGSLLQTAVLACAPHERDELEATLRSAGCTRVCRPGEAHFPPPTWPHDGIGRFAPLVLSS